MTRKSLVVGLVAVFLGGGCIGVSQPRTRPPSAEKAKPVVSETALAAAGIKSCPAKTRPADDGDLDDFEDRDTQLTRLSTRDGYWWSKLDPNGSTLNPKSLAAVPEGASGSQRAMHIWGKTVTVDGAWGAGVGVNFLASGPYDASRYAGIAFKAKVSDKSTRKFRFKIGDANTHPEGGICTTCWNHFGKDLEFTTEWQEYKVLFASATQEAGWGKPRPETLAPDKLIAIDWSISPGNDYDLWLDDIYFLDCE